MKVCIGRDFDPKTDYNFRTFGTLLAVPQNLQSSTLSAVEFLNGRRWGPEMSPLVWAVQ